MAQEKPKLSLQAQVRKTNKPVMEKRRRERINRSLTELKALIVDACMRNKETERSSHPPHSKLEKADILELTVRHLKGLRTANAAAVEKKSDMASRYRLGYQECVREVARFLGKVDEPKQEREMFGSNFPPAQLSATPCQSSSLEPPTGGGRDGGAELETGDPTATLATGGDCRVTSAVWDCRVSPGGDCRVFPGGDCRVFHGGDFPIHAGDCRLFAMNFRGGDCGRVAGEGGDCRRVAGEGGDCRRVAGEGGNGRELHGNSRELLLAHLARCLKAMPAEPVPVSPPEPAGAATRQQAPPFALPAILPKRTSTPSGAAAGEIALFLPAGAISVIPVQAVQQRPRAPTPARPVAAPSAVRTRPLRRRRAASEGAFSDAVKQQLQQLRTPSVDSALADDDSPPGVAAAAVAAAASPEPEVVAPPPGGDGASPTEMWRPW